MHTDLLFREYTKVLETGEFSDTEILVGEEPNTKIFRLHSFILRIHSPYFRTALSKNDKVKIENNIIKFQKPNISVKVFEILIKYLYSLKLELASNDITTNVALLIAADELRLNDLCIIIGEHLLKDEKSLSQICQNVANATFDQEILLSLVKALKPNETWNIVMNWCTIQSDELSSDITSWTSDNVPTFRTLVQSFIPYISLINNFDSKIINLNCFFLIAKWIKLTKEHENVTYDFNLLLRGSRDGFDGAIFHKNCDFKGPTITIVRVRDTNEILGGFNPLSWEYNHNYNSTNESFIFSLDKNNLENFIFSKVIDFDHAINNYFSGPYFGGRNSDLELFYKKGKGQCVKISYEKTIRQSEEYFEIDDYEVFQVIYK